MTRNTSDAQMRAVAKYDAANTTQIHLKLNLTSDADILARLDEVSKIDAKKGKQGYIKDLIRQDILEHPIPR